MTTYGLDLLGLGSSAWDIKSVVNKFPKNWALGCFGGGWPHAFGDPRNNVRKIIDAASPIAVRVHLWWSYEHQPASLDFIKKHAPLWEEMAKAYRQVKFYVSPSCEYKTQDKNYIKEMAILVEQLAPSCIPVLNPETGSPGLLGYIIEKHGSHADASLNQIASWDGQSAIDGNIENWKKINHEATISFLWVDLFNMLESHNVLFPDKRTSSPNERDYESIIRLANPIGNPLTPLFGGHITPIVKPYLYKVWAEDIAGVNLRDKKPLVIIKSNQLEIDLIDYKGNKFGHFIIFGTPGSYPGGLTRYYSGQPGGMNRYGWEIADKCRAQSGSEWGWFKAGNEHYGPVNFSFRAGFFQ